MDMNKIMEPLELFYPMLLPVISYFCSCYREKTFAWIFKFLIYLKL